MSLDLSASLLVTDNLALGQPWYRGFHDLMTKLDPVSRKPKRLKLSFEKAGLKNMIENVEWNDSGEKAIVLAVHQAIKQRLGQIAGENKGKQGVMKNRMQGEFDKWRLAFSSVKDIRPIPKIAMRSFRSSGNQSRSQRTLDLHFDMAE